jgi:hypothetical protein
MAVQHICNQDDKKQEVEMIEDKLMPEDASVIEHNPIAVIQTCFEGYTEEETKALSKKLVRLIDFRVLPVLILLFLVRPQQMTIGWRSQRSHSSLLLVAQHPRSKQHC